MKRKMTPCRQLHLAADDLLISDGFLPGGLRVGKGEPPDHRRSDRFSESGGGPAASSKETR